MLPTDIDRPDIGSIEIRIYPVTGTSTTVQPGQTTQTVVSVDVSQQTASQAFIDEFNRTSGGAGLLANPSTGGPIRTVYAQKTIQTNTPISVTTPTVGSPIVIRNFLSYDYREHYLAMPCDAWSFTVAAGSLSRQDRQSIRLGSKVEAWIDGCLQTTGWLDKVRTTSAADAGSILTLEGRSWISQVVDAHIDPQQRFSEAMTLEQFAQAVLAPFGVQAIVDDNESNRNVITGALRGIATSKKGRPLKQFVQHLEKPYPAEGAWAFLCRVAQRFGVWPRAAADGKTVVFSTPDFDQQPTYRLQHTIDDGGAHNNVLASDVTRSREEQPTVIFGFGAGGGGEWALTKLKGAVMNPLIAPQAPATLASVLGAYPNIRAELLPLPAIASAILDKLYPDPVARPLFLYDDQSHTQEQLRAFLLREMSLRMRKALDARYTILGHRIGARPVAVDTMIDVQDDVSDLHIPLWVLGRHFSKTKAGTVSEFELIRPGTIFLS